MYIIDGIKLSGKPAKIPESSRDQLPEFFINMGFKKGAEIGVYRGEFTEEFAEAGLEMYAIDPWIGYVGAGRTEKIQNKQDVNYTHAKDKLSKYKNCTLVRKSSMDALNNFKDGSLDFVYIDGDHRFRFIAEDIVEWYKKVRIGGVVSGHDYFNTPPKATNVICHVKEVVDAFTKAYDIENFYTVGHFASKEKAKTHSDRTLSWMFVKQ